MRGFCHKRRRCALGSAFTLVELLVVIAIVAVLVAILFPSLQLMREQARTTQCLANVHELSMAYLQYAVDHDGTFSGADTRVGDGWADMGNTLTQYTTGDLYPYLTDPNVYNCPDASNEVNSRSYSVNQAFGNFNNGSGAWYWEGIFFGNMRQVKKPAQTYIFIEEFDSRGWNYGPFVIPFHGWGSYFQDIPAHRHGGDMGGTFDSRGNANNIGFADGRVERWIFTDQRTLGLRYNSAYMESSPGNIDLARLQDIIGGP